MMSKEVKNVNWNVGMTSNISAMHNQKEQIFKVKMDVIH